MAVEMRTATTNRASSDGSHARSESTNLTAVATWIRLARIYHKIDRTSSEAFRAHGLTVAQFDVLVQVGHHPGCSQQELADRLLVTKGNVAQVLTKMEV